jgi:ubiquinone/menaquinone biosynthesis C-methylase UbiE
MVVCPICKTQNTGVYISVNGYSLLKCGNCGVVYTVLKDVSKVKETINKIVYNEDYISSYKKRKSELKNRFAKYLNLINKYQSSGRILDIGCGLGYFLEVAKESIKNTWSVYGLETNTSLVASSSPAVKNNISVGALPHLPYKDNYFDCVTCFDVLEHSALVDENLKEIQRVLKPKGLLVVQSPNHLSLMACITKDKWDWWSPPDHVLHFFPGFLVSRLKLNKYSIKYLKTYEQQKDFMSNVRGAVFRQGFLYKILFILAFPFLVILEKIAGVLGYGGLVLIIAEK